MQAHRLPSRAPERAPRPRSVRGLRRAWSGMPATTNPYSFEVVFEHERAQECAIVAAGPGSLGLALAPAADPAVTAPLRMRHCLPAGHPCAPSCGHDALAEQVMFGPSEDPDEDISEVVSRLQASWRLATEPGSAWAGWRCTWDAFWVVRLTDDIYAATGTRGVSGHVCLSTGFRCLHAEQDLRVCVERLVAFDSAALIRPPALMTDARYAQPLIGRLVSTGRAFLPGTQQCRLEIERGALRLTLRKETFDLWRRGRGCVLCAAGAGCPHAGLAAFAERLGL